MARSTTGELLTTARALLDRLDHITTDEFACGGERTEREALRTALVAAERAAPDQAADHYWATVRATAAAVAAFTSERSDRIALRGPVSQAVEKTAFRTDRSAVLRCLASTAHPDAAVIREEAFDGLPTADDILSTLAYWAMIEDVLDALIAAPSAG